MKTEQDQKYQEKKGMAVHSFRSIYTHAPFPEISPPSRCTGRKVWRSSISKKGGGLFSLIRSQWKPARMIFLLFRPVPSMH